MEMLQLRYFYESAQNESFAKTAEKYMVPTTSVSASVKRLEKELGCQLFDRTSNRVTLNPNGKRLQQSLCLVFAELDGAVDALSSPCGDEREIRMLVRAVRSNITERIIAYNARHPQIAFQTVFDFAERDFKKYDVIIDRKSDVYEGFESFELCTMRIRLKAAVGHPLCRKNHTLKQLCDQPFISWGEGSNMHNILQEACRRVGFSPRIAVQTNDKEC
ncbi:MAG: LysR family transcriptional regulator, partial [Clostridia bacterium]|nr:LysR family transcriptional regulator [Clostridia bacterium]